MAMTKLQESVIPQRYVVGLCDELCYDFDQEHVYKILDSLVTGVSNCLSDIKSKDYPVAFEFREPNKTFICAALVQYFPNEDDATKPGNWNYSWTFNEDDVPKNARVCQPYDPQLFCYFRAAAHTKFGMIFEKLEFMGDMFRYLLTTIKQWLDENAAEGEVMGIELDDVIQFRVAIEDGEKVMSIEPSGEVKQLIKDDAAIEK